MSVARLETVAFGHSRVALEIARLSNRTSAARVLEMLVSGALKRRNTWNCLTTTCEIVKSVPRRNQEPGVCSALPLVLAGLPQLCASATQQLLNRHPFFSLYVDVVEQRLGM